MAFPSFRNFLAAAIDCYETGAFFVTNSTNWDYFSSERKWFCSPSNKLLNIFAVVLCVFSLDRAMAESLTVPASTAYLEPQTAGARVSGRGITDWKDAAVKVLWFGEIKTTGALDASMQLRLPSGVTSRLRLTVGGQSREAEIKGGSDETVTVAFGKFDIKDTGYHRFTLEALNAAPPFGDVSALVLDGPTIKDAHFNLKPRRNAASVHLRYPTPKGSNIAAFYCEVTGLEEPVITYYMACM